MGKEEVIVKRLREYLSYDPQTGIITWKKHKHRSTIQPGDRAGYIDASGYEYVRINRMAIASHIIAWALTYGECPENHIDHINGDRSDNRIVNLRTATFRQNQQNRLIHRNGRLPGALPKKNGKWEAKASINGKTKYLGLYPTAEEAHEAYVNALKEVHDAR